MAGRGGDWFDGGGGGSAIDPHELVGADALRGILEMVEAGALVSIGTTSDGGALAVTVTADGRWRREYHRTADDLMAWLAEAVPAVTDVLAASGARNGGSPASTARGTRSRRR